MTKMIIIIIIIINKIGGNSTHMDAASTNGVFHGLGIAVQSLSSKVRHREGSRIIYKPQAVVSSSKTRLDSFQGKPRRLKKW